MARKKKQKHHIGKKEFAFNFISLVAILGVCLYFGGRSLYYYSLQNIDFSKKAQTLSGLIINSNRLVEKDVEGLHQDNDGYYFKGNVNNNYVWYGNRSFRIVRVNKDKTVKLVSSDLVSSFMWGEEEHYEKSNLKYWLTDTKDDYSGVYYKTIPDTNYLEKTTYTEDIMDNNKVVKGKKKYSDDVTTLTINDYVLANGKSSYLNNGKIFYVLGLNKDDENLFVDEDGSIQSTDGLDGYGIRAVITLKENVNVTSGNGTKDEPYVIESKNNNYIDSYITLGNQKWKVFENTNGILKLYLFGYISNNGVEVLKPYSNTNSIFDINDRNNIANYLNGEYLNSLSYSNYLVDSKFYIGEVSVEEGYQYKNIYNNEITCKVGLLSIFDYVSNNYFDNYFHLNNTSEVSSMEYSAHTNGFVEEDEVTELKHIVPVISIDSKAIKNGSGTLNDPYVLE